MSLPAFKISYFTIASKKRSEFLIMPFHVLAQTTLLVLLPGLCRLHL